MNPTPDNSKPCTVKEHVNCTTDGRNHYENMTAPNVSEVKQTAYLYSCPNRVHEFETRDNVDTCKHCFPAKVSEPSEQEKADALVRKIVGEAPKRVHNIIDLNESENQMLGDTGTELRLLFNEAFQYGENAAPNWQETDIGVNTTNAALDDLVSKAETLIQQSAVRAQIQELERVLDNIHQGTLEPAVQARLKELREQL
jgi:hypothetical protein